jgi:hypothetical protein
MAYPAQLKVPTVHTALRSRLRPRYTTLILQAATCSNMSPVQEESLAPDRQLLAFDCLTAKASALCESKTIYSCMHGVLRACEHPRIDVEAVSSGSSHPLERRSSRVLSPSSRGTRLSAEHACGASDGDVVAQHAAQLALVVRSSAGSVLRCSRSFGTLPQACCSACAPVGAYR